MWQPSSEIASASDVGAALQQAVGLHQSGRIDEAVNIYDKILKVIPNQPDALNFKGLAAHQTGDFDSAIKLIGQALEHMPPGNLQANVMFLNNLGSAHGAARDTAAAVDCFRRALDLDPNFYMALDNLGNALVNDGKLTAAATYYRRMIDLEPGDEDAHCKLAAALIDGGDLEAGIKCLRDALKIEPDFIIVWNNLGQVLGEKGEFEEAIQCFEKILEIDPDDAGAYCNLSNVYREQGRLDDAETAARKAVDLDPSIDNAHTQLGLLLLAREQINEASDEILAPAKNFRQPDGDLIAAKNFDTFNRINKQKLIHDIEQLTYLIENEVIDEDEFGWLLEEYKEHFAAHPELEETDLDDLRPRVSDGFAAQFNRLWHFAPAPMIPGGTINPDLDTTVVEEAFFDNDPNLSLVDDLLTEEALASLRKFCLESTVWYNISASGDVGANLEHGFCCPLLLQVAADIRSAFPRLYSDLIFSSCWSFKYYEKESGDGLHGDSGLRNLNLWLTPDDANLDTNTGGLTFWDKKVPLLEIQNSPKEKSIEIMRNIISEPNTKATKVPYKGNRAGLFESNIIHCTDTLNFKPGYENRRINITFVYGMPDY
jgi:tetratricopeptide (TPR) repeat protein